MLLASEKVEYKSAIKNSIVKTKSETTDCTICLTIQRTYEENFASKIRRDI